MILVDWQIEELIKDGTIECDPFDSRNIQPASLDLRLGNILLKNSLKGAEVELQLVGDHGQIRVVNALAHEAIELKDRAYDLAPGEFILASTLECIGSRSPYIVSQLADKSTLARLGLAFSSALAGSIRLLYGMHICQLVFYQLEYPVRKLYQGKYQDSKVATGAV